MPRFVVLAHDWPEPHFDLLLEAGGTLKSWRLAARPTPGVSVAAEANADHRLRYLDYEGPVSGGRGAVTRVLAGEFAGDILPPTWEVVFTLTTGEVLTAGMSAAGFRLGQPPHSSRHQSA